MCCDARAEPLSPSLRSLSSTPTQARRRAMRCVRAFDDSAHALFPFDRSPSSRLAPWFFGGKRMGKGEREDQPHLRECDDGARREGRRAPSDELRRLRSEEEEASRFPLR